MDDPSWPVADDRDWLAEIARRLASPGARIVASLIDGAIVFAPVLAAALVIGFDEAADNAVFIVVTSLWAALYDVLLIGLSGATIGKRILGIKVVRQVDGVTPPGLEVGLKRWLVNMVGLVPALFMMSIGLTAASTVLLFVDVHRRAIHDRIAGTYVVQA